MIFKSTSGYVYYHFHNSCIRICDNTPETLCIPPKPHRLGGWEGCTHCLPIFFLPLHTLRGYIHTSVQIYRRNGRCGCAAIVYSLVYRLLYSRRNAGTSGSSSHGLRDYLYCDATMLLCCETTILIVSTGAELVVIGVLSRPHALCWLL